MRMRLAPLGLVSVLLLPLPAAAQILSPPERAAEVISRTTDQTRSTQSLDFGLNLLGGFDQNDTEQFQVVDPNAAPVFIESTSNTSVNASLAYSRVSGTRVLGVTLNGGSTFYSGGATQEVGPTKNFNGGLTWSTPIGSSARFSASQRLLYDSLYSLGAFGPIESEVPIGELPGSGTQGVASLESFSSDTTVGLERRLGRRNALNSSYGYSRRSFIGAETIDTGGEAATGDTSSQSVNVGLSRQLQRTTGLNVSYGYSSGQYAPLAGGGGTRPLVGHVVQGGMNFSKRLSPRRAAQFSFSLGATRTDAVTGDAETNYTFWAPSGSVQARVDLARTWALSTNYSRGTTALSGLTLEAYSSDAFGTSLGGSVGRLGLVFTAGLGRGATGVGAEESSDYKTYTGAVQASMPIGKRLSALVEYSWYRYEVTSTAELPSTLPPQFRRSSIRAGLSLRLPIIEAR